MQLYPNFTAQPGLQVIKKFNINSITQLTCSAVQFLCCSKNYYFFMTNLL